jgi:hypothetical protein
MIDIACIFSAFCFFLSNALGAAVAFRYHDHIDYEQYKLLETEDLIMGWELRRMIAPMMNASATFNALAWFALAIPVIQLSWILSRGGKRQVSIHATMGFLALGGAIIEMLSKLMLLGAYQTANWVSEEFSINSWSNERDGIGWKSLEVTLLVIEGAFLC